MPPKERSQSHAQATAKQNPPRREAANDVPSPARLPQGAAVRRAAVDPGSLTAREVLRLHGALGNRAVGRLLSEGAPHRPSPARASNRQAATGVIQLANGKKKSKADPQEEKWRKELESYGFTKAQVHVAGMGTAGADISASDASRLWLFEVKGKNDWISAKNIAHEGNVPAKQLAERLSGTMGTTVRVKAPVGEGTESVDLKKYISSSEDYGDARKQILLGASDMNIDDAILALQYDTEKNKVDFTKGAALPLSINAVLRYMMDVVELIPDTEQRKEYSSKHAGNVYRISEAWDDWTKDGRSFFVENPEYLTELESAYTALRKTGYRHELNGTTLEQLDDKIEFKFLPVVKNLQHVEKEEDEETSQLKRVGVGAERPRAGTPEDGPGRPLPEPLKSEMEAAFSTDLSPVRVHEGYQAPLLGALAYTRGEEIHFARGLYDTSSSRGRELIGHELAHVIQQRENRVPRPAGSAVQEDPALEQEADAMGVRAARGEVVGVGVPDAHLSTRADAGGAAQLLKFASVAAAREFLRAHLTGPIPTDGEWDAFEALLTGTAYAVDMQSNYGLLLEAYQEIAGEHDVQDVVAARTAKKERTLSEAIWRHIAYGEITVEKKSRKLVGYHWTGLGAAAVAEGFGDKSNVDAFGAYKQSVKERGVVKDALKKTNQSSFFPDAWSAAEVRMSIEYAVQDVKTKPFYRVTLPTKGAGLILTSNPDSYFPNL